MTYTVKKGDSLSKIARDILGNLEMWPQLAAQNNISAPYTIYPGQVLQLPPAGASVVVVQEESLAAGWLRQDRILIGVVGMIVILIVVWIYQNFKS